MRIGRYGTLFGFAVQVIGAGVALADPEAEGFGYALIMAGALVLVAANAAGVYSHRAEIRSWARRVGATQVILLVGVAGTWLFMTTGLGAVAWMLIAGSGAPLVGLSSKDDGPLVWFVNLTMEGGPNLGRNVYALIFKGANVSQKEVRLKSAEIRSANKGTALLLEVIAANEAAGKNEAVSLDQIQLIPAGAPIELVAKFNLPEGLSASDFLATWSKFTLVVTDETREYRMPFNEGNLAPFFPGLVGPRVTKKPDPKQG